MGIFGGILGSAFGGSGESRFLLSDGERAAMQANAQANAVERLRAEQAWCHPTKTVPAGIFRERAGPREWRVTIRRKPETVIDWCEIFYNGIAVVLP